VTPRTNGSAPAEVDAADEAPARDLVAETYRNWEAHGWDGGPRLKAALSIDRVADVMHEVTGDVLAKFGLTYARHEVLAVLYFSHKGSLPMGRLAHVLMVHPTSVSSTIKSLESSGLVERVHGRSDRRMVRAQITKKGRDVMKKSSTAILRESFGLSSLSDEDAEVISTVLEKVRRASMRRSGGILSY
jgi:DNA-binding MarR family transcriptional regulator